MATAAEKKQAYEQWKEHCKRVQSITDTALLAGETPAQKDRRILRLQGNYAAFCEYYFPHFLTLRDKTTGEVIRTIHNAPFHNAAAAKVKGTPNLKAVFMWPRGHAKSTHMDIFCSAVADVPAQNVSSTSWWWSAKVRTQPHVCWEIFRQNWNITSASLPTSASSRGMPPGRMGSSRRPTG